MPRDETTPPEPRPDPSRLEAPPAGAPLLALDTASPVVSVAVGAAGEPWAIRSVEIRRSSERLLALAQEALDETGHRVSDLAAVLALAGPGSFTGLRVGLATALGLHQATGMAAAALPSLEVLATSASLALEAEGQPGPTVAVAAVDALRGEWFVRPFRLHPGHPPEPLEERQTGAAILSPEAIAALGPELLVGFGVAGLARRLEDLESLGAGPVRALEPGADGSPAPCLAEAALHLAGRAPLDWSPAALTRPLYLRQPAVTVPKPRPASTAASPTKGRDDGSSDG